jgi:hypothetical protein
MEVLAYRLDDFSALKNRQFDAIKIDVENFEYEVFMGALNILNRDKPMIYCELWDNQNRKDCFKLLSRIGYKIYVHENGSLRLLDTAKTNTQNFFFIHSES